MIDTLKIFNELQKTLDPEAARAITDVLGSIYEDLQNTVTKSDFGELRDIVQELAEAQKRTEARVEELAEAQGRTEAKLEELAEAQGRTEARVEKLAEAQERTEARVEKLAEAQERTEARLERLAEAQEKTELELRGVAQGLKELTKEHKKTREQVGGLSNTVGYILENEAFKALPALLKRDHGLTVKGALKRQYVTGRKLEEIEVNIFGQASKNGETVTIIGESKTQLSKKAVDDFLRRKVRQVEARYQNIFRLLVTHMTTASDVEEYARKKGVAVYYSYDF